MDYQRNDGAYFIDLVPYHIQVVGKGDDKAYFQQLRGLEGQHLQVDPAAGILPGIRRNAKEKSVDHQTYAPGGDHRPQLGYRLIVHIRNQ